jgi:hypothetical protein
MEKLTEETLTEIEEQADWVESHREINIDAKVKILYDLVKALIKAIRGGLNG